MLVIKWRNEISHVVPDKTEELNGTNGSLLPEYVRSKESIYVKLTFCTTKNRIQSLI